MSAALTVMERTVMNNADAEVYWSYKYFDDTSIVTPHPNGLCAMIIAASTPHDNQTTSTIPSDLGVLAPEARGAFTPLWKLTNEAITRKQTVTALAWNPVYCDLVAVGYGSYDFATNNKNNQGVINCYSLKNPSYPESHFKLPSGVMSVAWHPSMVYLLAVGLHNGMVCILDVSKPQQDNPIYISDEPLSKHTGPVWQVHWNEDAEKLNFYSVSSDGHLCNWAVNQNLLDRTDVLQLRINNPKTLDRTQVAAAAAGSVSSEDQHRHAQQQDSLVTLYSGTCCDFNNAAPLVVVGTEEGQLLTYDIAYNATLKHTYEGHTMAVYKVEWNKLHPNTFISCSADWTVKLWDYTTYTPIMTLDMHTSVGDVCWSPHKSTMFSCITTDGWLRLFDLKASRVDPIGEHRLLRSSTKLTHIAFNHKDPVIVVGDDKGVTSVFKLSSKLRQLNAPSIDEIDPVEEQSVLANLLVIKDENRQNKKIQFISPRIIKNKRTEEEEQKKAAAAAQAKQAKAAAEDEE